MGNSYRVIVPGDDAKASALRLGYYMSGDEGFPPNYTDAGDVTETTGILMTTKGQYALVSGKPTFAQFGKDVGWQVAGSSDGWDLTAADDLTITAKSLYLQSDRSVTATEAAPGQAVGAIVIETDADFKMRSHDNNVQILCEKGGYKATMTSGWQEIWGNQVSLSNVSTSIKLLEAVSIKAGATLGVTMYYCAVRVADSSLAFNSSSAVMFSAGATGTELTMDDIKAGVSAIGTKISLAASAVKAAAVNAVTIDFGDLSIDISQEDIDSDLFGASSYINAAPQIVTE
ncbi:hypothetical protein [Amorphus coralli]|uniref:hypothetical protein n=1 Tax=Amorphus coralli TaxID=340680 RepID=UPI0003758CD0|nr:hypothetical protein [Amorphus coralli]